MSVNHTQKSQTGLAGRWQILRQALKRNWPIFGFFLLLGLAIGLWRALPRKSNADILPTSALSFEMTPIKIYVLEEGMYQFNEKDLQAAGVQVPLVDPAYFRLYSRGKEQPLWFEGKAGDFVLRFWGKRPDSLYEAASVYILALAESSGGLTSAWNEGENVEPIAAETSRAIYLASEKEEVNDYYFPQVTEGDHWFWQPLSVGQKAEFQVWLDSVAPGRAWVRISFWGSTQAPVNPDHHIRVAVNGQQVADVRWDGVGQYQIEAELADGLLVEGTNRIEIEVPGDTAAPAEINLLDWIEFRYPRYPLARQGRLLFESLGNNLWLEGLRPPAVVLDVTDSEMAQKLGNLLFEGNKAAFRGVAGRLYFAVDAKGYLKPERIVPVSMWLNLNRPNLGVDYLAVGPADLLAPLQPLLDFRQAQGLSVLAVPVETIYDQFNYGYAEPIAVRDFVWQATQGWNPAPRFLLLVGDASYDPKGYLAPPEANRLPTFFVFTEYGGQTASDVLFGDLDEDGLPELAVGRLPARTPHQVTTFVQKVLAYEAGIGELRPRLLAIADGQDLSFGADAQSFLDHLAAPYQGDLYHPEAGVTGANVEIQRYFGEDYTLVAYFGHGSVTMWGKDRLFTVEDVADLHHAHFPIVMNMTCLTGLFTHPTIQSLAEALLWQPDGGSVAVLAPTSLTLPYDQSYLHLPFAEALSSGEYSRLGEVYLAVQQRIPVDSAGLRDVMRTFLFFGDPALTLPTYAP